MTDTNDSELEFDNDEWLPEDLEAAYMRALEANDAVEHEFAVVDNPSAADQTTTDSDDESLAAAFAAQATEASASTDGLEVAQDAAVPITDEQVQSPNESDHSDSDTESTVTDKSDEATSTDQPAESPLLATTEAKSTPRVTPHQVVEAALFVGGVSLTVKKLATLLGTDSNTNQIEEILDELNAQYTSENRPYEIKLVEGGYRLELRSEYDRVRNRVYGLGPKEVKLSQDAVEVLALVAYRQPITKSTIEKLGKSSPSGALRQLLRRQLIRIERGKSRKDDIKYHTTPRFLSLFGLGDLEELPQADELNLK